MVLLFPIDEGCPVCRKASMHTFEENAVHCKELYGFKFRHDFVMDALLIYSSGREYHQRRRASELLD